MKVLILQPQLDLPFKQPILAKCQAYTDGTVELRRWWSIFTQSVATAFARHGHNAQVLIRPNWELVPKLIDTYAADLVFIPHRQQFQIEGLDTPALYYMQMFCRHLFTVDPWGWGPTASTYPCDFSSGDPDSMAFEALRARMLEGNESKFAQPARKEWAPPADKSIFFPCQVPHDETGKFHANLPEVVVVRDLAAWAKKRKVHVVFKDHPANPKSMEPLRKAAPEGTYVTWVAADEASVHDLIDGAQAVYTINSGVGFEALFHCKPVMVFGRSEYDVVAFKTGDGWAGGLSLDEAWDVANKWGTGIADTPELYRRFVDWYISTHAIELREDDLTWPRPRFDALVAQGELIAEGTTP